MNRNDTDQSYVRRFNDQHDEEASYRELMVFTLVIYSSDVPLIFLHHVDLRRF